jgi:hypothetical protein
MVFVSGESADSSSWTEILAEAGSLFLDICSRVPGKGLVKAGNRGSSRQAFILTAIFFAERGAFVRDCDLLLYLYPVATKHIWEW